MAKKRGLIGSDVLTRRNCDKWFNYMKRYLKSKSRYWTVEKGEKEYLLSAILSPILLTPAPTASSSTPSVPAVLNGLGTNADEEAQLTLITCIDDDDQEAVTGMATASNIWHYLRKKYKRRLEVTNTRLLREYLAYTKPPDKSIIDACGEINSMARRITEHNPTQKSMASEKQRLRSLLSSLPSEYGVLVDVFRAQTDLDADVVILKLQDKEVPQKYCFPLSPPTFRAFETCDCASSFASDVIVVSAYVLD